MPGCSPRQYLVVYWCLVSLALLCYLNAQAGCFTLLTSRDHQAATPASKQGLGVCTPEGSTIKPLSPASNAFLSSSALHLPPKFGTFAIFAFHPTVRC